MKRVLQFSGCVLIGIAIGWYLGYYRLYRGKGGDTNIIAQIEKAAQDHPELAAELSRKIE